MIAHVSGLQGVPTTKQLASKCTALSDAIIKSAIGLPHHIMEISTHQLVCCHGLGSPPQTGHQCGPLHCRWVASWAALNEILEGACNYSPRIEPTEEELASLSLACSASSMGFRHQSPRPRKRLRPRLATRQKHAWQERCCFKAIICLCWRTRLGAADIQGLYEPIWQLRWINWCPRKQPSPAKN